MTSHVLEAGNRATFAATGEDLCLAFANTRYWRGRPAATETLPGFGDLVAWLKANAGLPADLVTAAQAWSAAHADAAATALADAIALREAIYRLFGAVAAGEAVSDSDVAILNRALAEARPRTRLARRADGVGWAAASLKPTLPVLLAPVSWSAADLLTHAADRRIRRCANDECLWLFMDHSKGGTRRWCDMNSCGNRAKSRRHYGRARQDKV
ncbi:MAG: CGNR zinc finger domain-containing protein [Stellaceae bacterium]